MLIKYYSLKTYREVLRKKGASAGIDFSQRKHRSTSQRCQPGCILNSRAAPVAMKSLLLNFPLRGCFRKCSSFHISLSTRDSSIPGFSKTSAAPDGTSTALDETSAVPDETSTVMNETNTAWDGTSAAADGLLGSRRHFASTNPTLVMGFRSHHA